MAYVRGRGRGKGASFRGRGSHKPRFSTSRVAKPAEEDSESSEQDVSDSEDGQSQAEEDSTRDGEEETIPAPVIRPYSILLQTLNTGATRGQPERKKRRVEKGMAEEPPELQDEEDESSRPAVGEDRVGPLEELVDVNDDHDPDEPDNSDSFETHFAGPDEGTLSRSIKALSKCSWHSHRFQHEALGKALLSVPAAQTDVRIPNAIQLKGPGDLKLKKRLSGPVHKIRPEFNAFEGGISPYIFNNQDLLFCNRSLQNAESLRILISLHALNHVLKTRDHVIKNNARLAKGAISEDTKYRDQGFTRPKILIILPTRQSCVKMVDAITAHCEPEQQENKKRFQDSFDQQDEKISPTKPEDFRDLFAGNDDDMFRIGLKFTRKTIKFFSQFYNSDIIIGSPLGLRMAIGAEDAKTQDYDFLSSIEIVIMDQADALLMQNWEHVEYIFDHLNLQPREAHGCDFSRVRNWYLDGSAKFLRQTIILSAFNTPELNRLFSNHMNNIEGKAKIARDYDGAMLDTGLMTKQTFSRYDSPQPVADPDARFKYFITAVVPSLNRYAKSSKDAAGEGILLFIPSYLDFVRVRNYFSSSSTTQNISFGAISEYTPPADVARARSHFLSGKHSVLLYTERAHHFRRYVIKGVKRVILYGLPNNPVFYREIVGGYLERSIGEGKLDPGDAVVRSVFSKWDALKLERIVGTKRVGTMIRSIGDTFDFV